MGRLWCARRVIRPYVMANDIIHRSLSPIGNLKNQDPRSIVSILYLLLLRTQPLLWGDIQ